MKSFKEYLEDVDLRKSSSGSMIAVIVNINDKNNKEIFKYPENTPFSTFIEDYNRKQEKDNDKIIKVMNKEEEQIDTRQTLANLIHDGKSIEFISKNDLDKEKYILTLEYQPKKSIKK